MFSLVRPMASLGPMSTSLRSVLSQVVLCIIEVLIVGGKPSLLSAITRHYDLNRGRLDI